MPKRQLNKHDFEYTRSNLLPDCSFDDLVYW